MGVLWPSFKTEFNKHIDMNISRTFYIIYQPIVEGKHILIRNTLFVIALKQNYHFTCYGITKRNKMYF